MDDLKYALSVKLIGVMHKESVKLYMTSVLWSDQNEIVVYRSFQDFRDLHKELKKRFPPTNPLKKSDRVVPKFKVKKVKRNVRKKGPSKSVLKLKSLERYCNDLMSCDPRVAQSTELRQFFLPNEQDLTPEFAKNSIVIMPSEDNLDGSGGGGRGGNVTQPFVTETYRCVAPYETKDTKNRPFKVEVDETVDVLIKDKAGWWMVENAAKCMAWFPAPYLKKVDTDFEDDLDDNDGGVLYCSSRAFKAKSSDELSVSMGNVVEVLQKSENGWWLVRHNRKTGYIPSMYLQPYINPRVELVTSQNNLRGSSLNLDTLQAPHSQELSRSQGNLLQLPGLGSQTPAQGLNPQDRYKSRSLNLLTSESDIYQTPRSLAAPSIRVDAEPTGHTTGLPQSISVDSVDSMIDSSDSSEFSFSDDGSSMSGTDSLNQSRSDLEDELRRSRTPPPPSTRGLLSPDSGLGGRLQPSRSDPNLHKIMPKVPPRPQAQDILKRCTTVTRKNAARNQLAPSIHTR
ncbi:NADPH oxidase organizer 1a isoform X1 [Alosa sapidissima]|uniref:NADPH oxidase organizer 1a isoform X1 n=1 Tax=Alosa sapidissima TaxID=34773 RepID=UPI001C09BBA0|nr:NADPH oxidase organizer 1a isoform X1 [Alosa sapidissima]